MKIVLDATIALKWFLNPQTEPHFHAASALLVAASNARITLAAPPHFIAEVLAVIARKEPDRLRDVLTILYGLPIAIVGDESVHELAAQMSVALSHHMFDTLYQAVAILEAATFVTADEAYFAKASALGGIALLSNFKL